MNGNSQLQAKLDEVVDELQTYAASLGLTDVEVVVTVVHDKVAEVCNSGDHAVLGGVAASLDNICRSLMNEHGPRDGDRLQ